MKKTHRLYVVRQHAYIHINDGLNFSVSPNKVTYENIYITLNMIKL